MFLIIKLRQIYIFQTEIPFEIFLFEDIYAFFIVDKNQGL